MGFIPERLLVMMRNILLFILRLLPTCRTLGLWEAGPQPVWLHAQEQLQTLAHHHGPRLLAPAGRVSGVHARAALGAHWCKSPARTRTRACHPPPHTRQPPRLRMPHSQGRSPYIHARATRCTAPPLHTHILVAWFPWCSMYASMPAHGALLFPSHAPAVETWEHPSGGPRSPLLGVWIQVGGWEGRLLCWRKQACVIVYSVW